MRKIFIHTHNIIEINRRYRDVFPQGRCDDGL